MMPAFLQMVWFMCEAKRNFKLTIKQFCHPFLCIITFIADSNYTEYTRYNLKDLCCGICSYMFVNYVDTVGYDKNNLYSCQG
jgi:hypothetical protein